MKSKIVRSLSVTALSTLILFLALAPIFVPVKTQLPTITFLMHYNREEDVLKWGDITARYYDETGITVDVQSVDWSIFRKTILDRHALGNDPDMINMHCLWLPEFVTMDNGIGMLATPPDDVVANIKANWTASSIEAATFLNQIWGYPTEYNVYALVYNKDVLNQSGYSEGTQPGQYPPKNWAELLAMGDATTQRNDVEVINRTGFQPISFPSLYEEEKYQFLSLLWSNGGEFIQLPPPEKAVRFNETEGREVLQNLYIDTIDVTHDPAHMLDIFWDAWVWPWKLSFVVLPNWMGYLFIKSAMGANFTSNYVGIAPIPLGPHGTTPVSPSYNWMAVTTKKAEERGVADLAWDFYRWLFSPEPGKTTSRMGEFLIWYSVIPSKTADLTDPTLQSDFWFKAFMDIGAAYGRSDLYFKTSEAVQTCMGQMLEAVTIGVESIDDPEHGLQATATKVYNLIPVEPALIATLYSPANLYVTDPENRHIGTDPTTGNPINEIPKAFYTGTGTEPQQIIIPHPLDGVYGITIIGTGTGTYTLVVELATLTITINQIYIGNIVPGEILISEATISPGEITSTPPSPPQPPPPPPPEVPEFPIGFALEIAFMPILMYLWWKKRQRTLQ